jgi:hypothetical protein
MWLGPAEFVGYEKMGVADFADFKTHGADIASISPLISARIRRL